MLKSRHYIPPSQRKLRTKKRRQHTSLILVLLVSIIGVTILLMPRNKHPMVNSSSEVKPAVVTTASTNPNPLADLVLYADPNSDAAKLAKSLQNTNPKQAATMDKLAAQPTGRWLTSVKSLTVLPAYLASARSAKAAPILVAYNVPFRDCGRYSASNLSSIDDYKSFIDTLSKTIANDSVIIVLEPDAIAGLDKTNAENKPCLTEAQKKQVLNSINYAATKLKASPGVQLYIDAGNSGWTEDIGKMVGYLKQAGIDNADGFSTNVSNFQTTEDSLRYSNSISNQLGGKHFIIDTSRNGLGPFKNTVNPNYGWCNPPNRALGHYPTTNTGVPLADAYLYIKVPGESDGQDEDAQKCFGGPQAGTWWPEYALGLVERWPKALQP